MHTKRAPRIQSKLARICGHSFLGGVLTPDSIVFDLGANRGEFAREPHARWGCRVHAVEPSLTLAAGLRGYGWLTVDEVAVSAHPGAAWLVLADNGEASRLGSGPAAAGPGSYVVSSVTLEQLLSSADGPVDLVKMDIEGAELELLWTAPERTLRRIRQLTVEFHQFLDPRIGPRVEAVKRRLERLGFWALDFSRCNYDVLFARHELGLDGWARFKLRTQKYSAGLARRLIWDGRERRWTGGGSIVR